MKNLEERKVELQSKITMLQHQVQGLKPIKRTIDDRIQHLMGEIEMIREEMEMLGKEQLNLFNEQF